MAIFKFLLPPYYIVPGYGEVEVDNVAPRISSCGFPGDGPHRADSGHATSSKLDVACLAGRSLAHGGPQLQCSHQDVQLPLSARAQKFKVFLNPHFEQKILDNRMWETFDLFAMKIFPLFLR